MRTALDTPLLGQKARAHTGVQVSLRQLFWSAQAEFFASQTPRFEWN